MRDYLKKSTYSVSCALVACAVTISGCSSSSSPVESGANEPVDAEATNVASGGGSTILADQIANDASLGGSVRQIQELITSRSLEALSNLNQAYSSGILVPARIDCVDENAGFPVLEYYCGEAGVGERLSDFGFPAFALVVDDSSECRNSLINNDPAAACTVTYSDSELAGEWFVTYSHRNEEGSDVVSLSLSDGIVPEFVEFEEGSSVCEIKIIDQNDIEYSDQSSCRVSVAQVLAILNRP